MRLVIALAGSLLALTACGGGGGGEAAGSATSPAVDAAATSAAPDLSTSIKAARAVAREEADRYSAGDYAGTWELWTDAGKKAFSKADYAKLHAACPAPGLAYRIDNVRLESPGLAVARISVAGFAAAYTLKYEGGNWRWQPTDDDMKGYALGPDKLIAKMKAEGSC